MRVVSKFEMEEPLINPTGEVVCELLAAGETQGGTRKHSLAVVIIPPGKSSATHYHLVSEETYYILRGRTRVTVDT